MLRYILQSVLSPVPLYKGTTFVTRHETGASCFKAETLRNRANTSIEPPLNHFKHYNGKTLRPVLLFALKCDYNTLPNSSTLISNSESPITYLYSATVKSGLQNNY